MESLLLGYSNADLLKVGGLNTAKEIEAQTKLWNETYFLLEKHKINILNFLQNVYSQTEPIIILTGAGTSAFIGEVLEPVFQKHTGITCRAIPTTTLVTHPSHYFQINKPTLLISFARSGNSPESIKTVELANEICEKVFHLIITCDANGELAKSISNENGYLFVLPEGTNDKSLAMTSSFTSMLLSGILVSRIDKLLKLKTQVDLLCKYSENLILNYLPLLKTIANMDFDRTIFLGSGLFEGIARESQLKIQELSNGQVICKHDTFLGFRHGPKAVINNKTLIIYLISNDLYVQNYEEDLTSTLQLENNCLHTLAIMEKNVSSVDSNSRIYFSESDEVLEEEFLAVVATLPSQILGFFKSLNLGLKPDSPSVNGTISRVVKGVKVYSFDKHSSTL